MPTIEPFADVDVSGLAAWLNAVPVAEWPGMADAAWHGYQEIFTLLAETLMAVFPGCSMTGPGLFLLAVGQVHPTHTDEQAADWVTRVHVPIITNKLATATTDDGTLHMKAGTAYKFNTRQRHAVENRGTTPRVHMVFDVSKRIA